MNLILLRNSDSIVDGRVVLKDYRAKHIVKVLGSGIGDILRVGILNGKIGHGSICSLQRKYPFVVEIKVEFHHDPPEKSPIDLILAFPRPIMLRRILSQAASLGVENIHVVHARRVEKSFWEAGLVDEEEFREHLIHGLEQSIDTVLPKVTFHRRFKPFIEDFFPTIADKYEYLLFAHPVSKQRVHEIIGKRVGKTIVAIGPEGGWIDYEEAKFLQASFLGFTLGDRILKVDTAAISVLSRISAVFDSIP